MRAKKIKIRNLDLRDGHQSYFATRMTDAQIDEVLPDLIDAGYYCLEVWGGATLDSCIRFLNQDPWERLEKIAAVTAKKTELAALARGINLFGYNPYPDDVVYEFINLAVRSGITIMRIFDALNDMDNLKITIKAVQEAGGKADCGLCYTTNPVYTFGDKMKNLLKKGRFPKSIYNVKYFVDKAIEVEKMGADILTIKDMAGLVDPKMTYELISELKANVKIPVNLHSHCTPGYALTSHVAAIMAGVDELDTVSYTFSGGPSHPAAELVHEYAKKLGVDTGLNEKVFPKLREKLVKIRKELAPFDNYKDYKYDIPLTLTPEQHGLMDESIHQLQMKNFDGALKTVQKLEAGLGLPEPDEAVRLAQIPGGMYSNMISQLKELNLSHHLQEVLEEVPRVRINAGIVPLVTPTSQIVGVQAVKNVILKHQGKEPYSDLTDQYINLVKGEYGNTPSPISPEFRKKITGSREEKRFDTATWKHADVPAGMNLSRKDIMLLDLFPSVALKFLQQREKDNAPVVPDAGILYNEEFARMISGLSGNYLV